MQKQSHSKYFKFINRELATLFLLATTILSWPALALARSENTDITEALRLQQFTFVSGDTKAPPSETSDLELPAGSRVEITLGEINSPETLALAQQWARQAFRTATRANPALEISALSVVESNAAPEERAEALAETQQALPPEANATVGDSIGQTETPPDLNGVINQIHINDDLSSAPASFYDRHYRKIFAFYRTVSVTGSTTAAIIFGGNPFAGGLPIGLMGGIMSGSLQYQSRVVRYYLSGFPLNRVLTTLIPSWAPALKAPPITDNEATPNVHILKKAARWYTLEAAYMTATAATAAIVSRILEMPGLAPGHTVSAVAFSILSTSAISILSQGIPDLAILKAHETEIRRASQEHHLRINRRTDLKTMVVSAVTMGLGIANLCGVHGMKYGLATVGLLGTAYYFKVILGNKKNLNCETALEKPEPSIGENILKRISSLTTLLLSWL